MAWEWELHHLHKGIAAVEEQHQHNLYRYQEQPSAEERYRCYGSLSHDWFYFEFADQMSFFWQQNNPTSIPLPNFYPPAFWNTRALWITSPAVQLYNRIDRLYAQVGFGNLEARVGKQVVPLGASHIFPALNQSPPYPYTVLDAEFPVTMDAVSVKLTGPLTLHGRFMPRMLQQNEDNFHVWAQTNLGATDIGVVAGVSDDKDFAGMEMTANALESVFHAEAVMYRNEQRASFGQAVVGWDRVLTKKWSIELEGYYNGFGTIGGYTLTPYRHISTLFRGVWYVGGHVTFEAGDRTKIHLLSIVNGADPSTLSQLSVSFSLGDNLDLLFAQLVTYGGSDSEFGSALPLPQAPLISWGTPSISYAVLRYVF